MQLKFIYKKLSGFSIMEVVIATILIAIVAGFALPNFSNAIQKARVRDATSQLSAIYAANMIQRARTNSYFGGSYAGIAQINPNLNLNLVANGMNYNYNGTAGTPGTFTATASPIGGTAFTVRIDQRPINPLPQGTPGGNPCCSAGSCPGLGAC